MGAGGLEWPADRAQPACKGRWQASMHEIERFAPPDPAKQARYGSGVRAFEKRTYPPLCCLLDTRRGRRGDPAIDSTATRIVRVAKLSWLARLQLWL